uniref:Uncharacterized protein n=1 Tax=Zea mays TaxID=4577 RepID=C4J1E3_MAIZE|nr:unknown [Zea mays]
MQYFRQRVVAGAGVAVAHLPLGPKEEPDTELRGAHRPEHRNYHGVVQEVPVPPQEPLRLPVKVGGVGSDRLGYKNSLRRREGRGVEDRGGHLKKGEVLG